MKLKIIYVLSWILQKGNGPESCHQMCCDRGFETKRERRVERCKCKFHWCCFVQCEECYRDVEVSTCKWARWPDVFFSLKQKHNFRHSLFKEELRNSLVLKIIVPKIQHIPPEEKPFQIAERASDVPPKSLFCKVPVFSKRSKVNSTTYYTVSEKKSSKFPITLKEKNSQILSTFFHHK